MTKMIKELYTSELLQADKYTLHGKCITQSVQNTFVHWMFANLHSDTGPTTHCFVFYVFIRICISGCSRLLLLHNPHFTLQNFHLRSETKWLIINLTVKIAVWSSRDPLVLPWHEQTTCRTPELKSAVKYSHTLAAHTARAFSYFAINQYHVKVLNKKSALIFRHDKRVE
jgi:hypothetical protein